MKLAHNVKLSVFAKQDEDEATIKQALLALLPFDLQKDKIQLRRTKATGFNEQKIVIFEVLLQKDRNINPFLEDLSKHLSSEQKELIVRQENRIDRGCNLFIRLDKEKLLKKQYWVTDSGSCFHIRICLACFPKNLEKASAVVKEIFK